MFTILAALYLTCPQPVLKTAHPKQRLSKHDYEVFERLKKNHKCAQYYEDAPCLKLVIKTAWHEYRATCGAEVGK